MSLLADLNPPVTEVSSTGLFTSVGWRVGLGHAGMVSRGLPAWLSRFAVAGCNTDALEFGTPIVSARAEALAPVRRPPGPYVLGLNDTVRVRVYSEADLSGEYVVDSSGFVSIPLAGRVRAAGLTRRSFSAKS